MVKIVQNGHPVLRAMAQEVPLKEISTPKIQKIIEQMKEALATQTDGVALAAPQIGISLRIFVVSGLLLKSLELTKGDKIEDLVFINPKITKLSKEKADVEEGCLSIRYLYGKIKRSTKATIEAYDESGNKIKRGASELLAQVFQHETDHLNGVLFIDSAYDLEDLPPEKMETKNKAKDKVNG